MTGTAPGPEVEDVVAFEIDPRPRLATEKIDEFPVSESAAPLTPG